MIRWWDEFWLFILHPNPGIWVKNNIFRFCIQGFNLGDCGRGSLQCQRHRCLPSKSYARVRAVPGKDNGSEAEAVGMGFSDFLESCPSFFTGVWFRDSNGEYEIPEVPSDDENEVFFQLFLFHLGCFFCWPSKEACLGSGTTDSYLNECLTSLRGHHWNWWVRFHHGAFWDLGRAVDSNL